MRSEEKIHILVKELIVLYDDLDPNSQVIVDQHIEVCNDCKDLFQTSQATFDNEKEVSQERESFENIRPFKKLYQFKQVLFILLLTVRFLLLGLILYNWSIGFPPFQTVMLTSSLILFYFPYVGLTNGVMFIFYRKLWYWIVVAFDVFVLLYFDDLVKLFT